MKDAAARSRPDAWEEEFLTICEELRVSLLGLEGSACALKIDEWEVKYRGTYLESFVVNHARAKKDMLLKNSGPVTMVVNQGNNSNFQQGANVAKSVGSNNATAQDNSVAVSSGSLTAGPNAPALQSSRDRSGSSYWTIAVCVSAGAIAGWWVAPEGYSLGPTRLIVTMCFAVAALLFAVIGWVQFRANNWQKSVYISLGSLILLRSFLPFVTSGIRANINVSENSLLASVQNYVGPTDPAWLVGLQVIVGAIVISFSLFPLPYEAK